MLTYDVSERNLVFGFFVKLTGIACNILMFLNSGLLLLQCLVDFFEV